MADWVRDLLIAVGAFIGGKAVNAAGARLEEGRQLRQSVDRLTVAVEAIGDDLRSIRGEIHAQVAALKVELHDQVTGLRVELHGHQNQQEHRLGSLDARIDAIANRCPANGTGG